ncbi:MAG: DnaD domain protein [Eubacteriales bacterium]|nr:DnaD domain protein [Eubacteriales bacterium]
MIYQADHFSEKEIAYRINEELLFLPYDLLKIHLFIMKSGYYEQTFTVDEIADKFETTGAKVQSVVDEYIASGKVKEKEQPEEEEHREKKLELCIYWYGMYAKKEPDVDEVADIAEICKHSKISPDYFMYILDYCTKRNRLSTSYMKVLVKDWVSRGLTTLAEAKYYFKQTSDKIVAAKKGFRISGRTLIPLEIAYVESWNYAASLIQYACERTLLFNGKPNFRYADAILRSWKEKGIHSLNDAKLDEKPRKTGGKEQEKSFKMNSFHNFEQRDYDYDALEALLLKRYQDSYYE